MSRLRAPAACDATGLTLRGLQAMAARGDIPGAAFKAAWALSNLQPLWAPDNLSKGATWADAA